MVGFESLKDSIKQAIRQNGVNEITGDILQSVLLSMIAGMGKYGTFAGIAIPSTNPGLQDGPVFYLAFTDGSYSYFNGIEINKEIAILNNFTGSSWVKETLPVDEIIIYYLGAGLDIIANNITAKGRITSENFQHGDSILQGSGLGIYRDENGNHVIEADILKIRKDATFAELVINRLSAIEGDQLLTEADTIDSIDDLGDNCYGLHLRSKWTGYFTAQAESNVLKGTINTLVSGGGEYHTSWMRVNSVNLAANYIEVVLYPDDETPAGKNYPPQELMKIARWGNQVDPTRQSCIYLSSTEGRIVRLTGVTKPITEPSNYGATFGTLPEFLKALDIPVIEGQDYIYARGLIVQDIIRLDYQGQPISEIVDRGQWSANEDYFSNAVNPTTGRYETSDVWYSGCKYRCAKTGSKTAPAWNNTDWAMIEGNPEFTVEFADTDSVFDPDRFAVTLDIIAKLYNQDVTSDILDADVVWTRYSEDANGVERVASDQAWALRRAGEGKSIDLTAGDCDFDGYVPRVLRFIATVTLRDGMGEAVALATTVFEY